MGAMLESGQILPTRVSTWVLARRRCLAQSARVRLQNFVRASRNYRECSPPVIDLPVPERFWSPDASMLRNWPDTNTSSTANPFTAGSGTDWAAVVSRHCHRVACQARVCRNQSLPRTHSAPPACCHWAHTCVAGCPARVSRWQHLHCCSQFQPEHPSSSPLRMYPGTRYSAVSSAHPQCASLGTAAAALEAQARSWGAAGAQLTQWCRDTWLHC